MCLILKLKDGVGGGSGKDKKMEQSSVRPSPLNSKDKKTVVWAEVDLVLLVQNKVKAVVHSIGQSAVWTSGGVGWHLNMLHLKS